MSCTNKSNLNKTFIIEAVDGESTLSACTSFSSNKLKSCSGDTEVLLTTGSIVINGDLIPNDANTLSIGTPTMRFRELNSVSGTTSVWAATNRVITPNLDLGVDLNNNDRVINADNSIIQDDILNGGGY